jgi:N-acetylneuraminate synthase
MAKNTGCDAVKFQKRSIGIVYSKAVLDSKRESPWGTTQRAQKEGLEFGKQEYDEIDSYCKEKKILWLASAWDIESQKFLSQYNHKYNKVASAMLTNLPLVKEIAKEGKTTFVSTGMSDLGDLDQAVELFNKNNCPIVLLHCVSTYPCAAEDCNLQVIQSLKGRYNRPVGYSGHEVGVLPSVLAVALGAVVIERHITLDRAMYGSDQAASLEKRGLEILVRDVRSIASIIGDGQKRVLDQERDTGRKLRYFREL